MTVDPVSELTTFTESTSPRSGVDVWNFFTERSSQINLMILFLHQDLANLFSHRIFAERFTLRDAIAIITNGCILIIEILAKHVSLIL